MRRDTLRSLVTLQALFPRRLSHISLKTGAFNPSSPPPPPAHLIPGFLCVDYKLDALTELCLAFEERPREEVVAALVSANYNPGEAAQVLLETSEEIPMGGNMALHSGQGGRKRRRAARRDQKRAVQSVGTASSLLGVTCGDRSRLGKAKNDGGGVEREDVVSEEEGDERLSSEIYRARAAAAAEDMKNWFHKAAEAFTKGGR